MMRRVWIVALATMVIIGTVGRSPAEEPYEGLLAPDLASCTDASVRDSIRAEAIRMKAIANLCDETEFERLFSTELSALDRGCKAVETTFVTAYTSLLADPEKLKLTCADMQTLLSTAHKAFRDAVNE